MQRAEGKTDSSKSVNAFLDSLERKVHDIRKSLIETNEVISATRIKRLLQGREEPKKKHMIMRIFEAHNDQMAALVGKDYSIGTYGRFLTSFKHTQNYLRWKYKVDDLDINLLDYEFISQYEFWLKSERNCDHNSAMKYLRNFKKIVLHCIKCGWLKMDPFLGRTIWRR